MNRPVLSRMFFVALGAGLALLAGCSSGPQIITNSAPGFDVSQYRSYAYMQPLSTDRGSTRSLISQQLIESTDFQLEALGLTQSNDNPDLLVNFFTSSKETIESRPTAGPTVAYGRGRYGTWGGYGIGYGTTTEVVQRTEGTLRIDIIDRERNELLWEGAATARITESMQQNRNAVINSAVNSIFAQFP
ncbi:MAG: DUF4136 domain-containing protein [Pseudomonadota bacterium]